MARGRRPGSKNKQHVADEKRRNKQIAAATTQAERDAYRAWVAYRGLTISEAIRKDSLEAALRWARRQGLFES